MLLHTNGTSPFKHFLAHLPYFTGSSENHEWPSGGNFGSSLVVQQPWFPLFMSLLTEGQPLMLGNPVIFPLSGKRRGGGRESYSGCKKIISQAMIRKRHPRNNIRDLYKFFNNGYTQTIYNNLQPVWGFLVRENKLISVFNHVLKVEVLLFL